MPLCRYTRTHAHKLHFSSKKNAKKFLHNFHNTPPAAHFWPQLTSSSSQATPQHTSPPHATHHTAKLEVPALLRAQLNNFAMNK